MDKYTVRAELVTVDDGTGDGDDNIISALDRYTPAVGSSGAGNIEVIISVPGADLADAARTATTIITDALGTEIIAIEVMSDNLAAARVGMPLPPLVSVTEAAALTGVTRQAILARLKSGALVGEKVGRAWNIRRDSLGRRSA